MHDIHELHSRRMFVYTNSSFNDTSSSCRAYFVPFSLQLQWLAVPFPSRPCAPRPQAFRKMRYSLELITRLLLSRPEVAEQKTKTESPRTILRACFYHTKIHIYILLILLLRKHRTLSAFPTFFFSILDFTEWTLDRKRLSFVVVSGSLFAQSINVKFVYNSAAYTHTNTTDK